MGQAVGSKVTLVAEGFELGEAAVLGAFGPHPGVVEAGPEVSELGLGSDSRCQRKDKYASSAPTQAELDLEENGSRGGSIARRYGPMRMGERDLGVVRVR